MVLAGISLLKIRRVFPGNTPYKRPPVSIGLRLPYRHYSELQVLRKELLKINYGKERNEKEDQVRVCGCV